MQTKRRQALTYGALIRCAFMSAATSQPVEGPFPAKVVVAISGGADSTSLLYRCAQIRQQTDVVVEAAHVAYGLRGEESEAEVGFVQSLCRSLTIPLHLRVVSAAEREGLHAANLQSAARQLRYDFFRACAGDGLVALGHTRDDQVETFFLQLLRGAGLSGLRGMEELAGNKFRPLLPLSRQDVLGFLEKHELGFCSDSSNEQLTYRRNRIRHEVMPVLRTLQPAVDDTVSRIMAIIAADDDCLRDLSEQTCKQLVREEPGHGYSISLAKARRLHQGLLARVMRMIIDQAAGANFHCTRSLTEEVKNIVSVGREGMRCSLRGPLAIVASRGRLYFHPSSQEDYRITLSPQVRQYDVHGFGFQLGSRSAIARNADGANCFPLAERRLEELHFRPPRAGERVGISGHERARSVQRVLADAQVPKPLRRRWPMLADSSGILWIAGLRLAKRAIGSETVADRWLMMTPSADRYIGRCP